MKKPKKILVITLVGIGLILGIGGFTVKSQMDKIQEEVIRQAQDTTTKVEQGKLEVKVVGSGNVVPMNKNNPNYDQLELEIEIDELDIPKVEINQKVEINIDALHEVVFEGRVVEVPQSPNIANGVSTFIVKISIPNPIIEEGVVNTDTLTVRKGKSSSYMEVTELSKNDKVEILAEEDNYYEIKTSDEQEGWVKESTIDIEGIKESKEAVVTKEYANVRKGASTNYGISVKIVEGDKVKIIDKSGNWYKVVLEDESEGFIYKDDVNPQIIKAGMSASVSILTDSKDDVLYIPIESVTKDEDGNNTVTLKNSTEPTKIEVGIHNEDYIEVISGLSNNEEIKMPTKKSTSFPDGMNPLTMPFKILKGAKK